MNIIVTGSLGHVGRPLVTQLLNDGHRVVVISTNASKQKEIESMGAVAAIGSLDDSSFLNQTLAGGDALFAMTPPNFKEVDQVEYYKRLANHMVDAIRKGGIRRLVYLSSYGAHMDKDSGFILGAHFTEQIFNGLRDVDVTYLRAGYFYYNLLNFREMIRHQGIIGTNFGGDDRLALVHPDDIADAAASELTRSGAHGVSIRYVISDEGTAAQVARELGNAIGKPDLQWLTFTDEQTRKAMIDRGVPASLADNFVALGASLHNGKLLEHYRSVRAKPTGKIRLADYAEEFARAYADSSSNH